MYLRGVKTHHRTFDDCAPSKCFRGFAAAQCGKALPYQPMSHTEQRLRLRVEAQPRLQTKPDGMSPVQRLAQKSPLVNQRER
jgi:hypothetical protein